MLYVSTKELPISEKPSSKHRVLNNCIFIIITTVQKSSVFNMLFKMPTTVANVFMTSLTICMASQSFDLL